MSAVCAVSPVCWLNQCHVCALVVLSIHHDLSTDIGWRNQTVRPCGASAEPGDGRRPAARYPGAPLEYRARLSVGPPALDTARRRSMSVRAPRAGCRGHGRLYGPAPPLCQRQTPCHGRLSGCLAGAAALCRERLSGCLSGCPWSDSDASGLCVGSRRLPFSIGHGAVTGGRRLWVAVVRSPTVSTRGPAAVA